MNSHQILESADAAFTPGSSNTDVSPIFILGILPRSGTNYLHDLIRLHPACDPDSSLLGEDHLLEHADLLLSYSKAVRRHWSLRHWDAEEQQAEQASLYEQLGNGAVSFLHSQREMRRRVARKPHNGSVRGRLVTKTPSVKNLERFFTLFPNSPLLILVRDGRSVVESAARTFLKPYGYAAREWASAAQIIRDFQSRTPEDRYLLVRYEQLYSNVEAELRRIFTFLHLDPANYDYRAAANLPVRGSSVLAGNSSLALPNIARGVHWEPVAKPAGFNPVERWGKWGRAKHARFNWIAGASMTALGYEPRRYTNFSAFWSGWNFFLDALYADRAAWFLRRAFKRVRTTLFRRQQVVPALDKMSNNV